LTRKGVRFSTFFTPPRERERERERGGREKGTRVSISYSSGGKNSTCRRNGRRGSRVYQFRAEIYRPASHSSRNFPHIIAPVRAIARLLSKVDGPAGEISRVIQNT